MIRAGGLCIALFGAAGLFAQGHAGSGAAGGHGGAGVSHRPGVGGVVPGGKNPPNIVYLASGTPQHATPTYGRTGVYAPAYGYSVYVPYGSYYGPSYSDGYYAAPAPAPDQSYAPVPGPGMYYPAPAYPPESAQMRTYVNPYVQQDPDAEGPPAIQADNSASNHYLIALKDHTVAAAVAYYVNGDTLHYFTEGNVHNQVSISAVDRELTDRLNKDSGKQVDLTPVKQ